MSTTCVISATFDVILKDLTAYWEWWVYYTTQSSHDTELQISSSNWCLIIIYFLQ